MANDTRVTLTTYDNAGTPLAGLTPTWTFCVDLNTNTSVPTPPTVEGLGHGVYAVTRLAYGHIVGQLDFGASAYPRYFTYDVVHAEPLWAFTSTSGLLTLTIIAVEAPARTQLRVTFSNAVRMTTAENGALHPDNWAIDDLLINSLTAIDERTVLLSTSTQIPEHQYILRVFNIEDLDGNVVIGT